MVEVHIKAIRRVYQESDDFCCPCCNTNLGKDYKRKLIDKLIYEDDLQIVSCPSCKVDFHANIVQCFELKWYFRKEDNTNA